MLVASAQAGSGQPPLAACAVRSTHGCLLLAASNEVSTFRVPPPPPPAAATEADAAPKRLWHQPISGGRVEWAASLAPDSYLMVTSHGSLAPARASLVQVLDSSVAQAGFGTGHHGQPHLQRHHVCAAVELGCAEGQDEPAARPAFSALLDCGDGSLALAASLHQATLHLLHISRGPGGTWSLAAMPRGLRPALATEPGAVVVLESLALARAGFRGSSLQAYAVPGDDGGLQATLLYTSHSLGGAAHGRHVVCLQLAAEGGHMCCWFLRNVRPSTSLVAALPGGQTLVAAADVLTLVPADAPQDKQQVAVQLAGRPTCAAVLSPSAAVVGDASGRLTLLDLDGMQAAPLALGAGLPPAAPTCLAFLPPVETAGGAAGAPGVLFVGSSSGGVLLRVPPAALDGAGVQAANAAAANWQPVGGGDAALLAAGLGPVLDCCAVPDPSGCGDTRLLMCCGAAPFSRLALAHLAAQLVPLAVGGGDLPGQVRLLGLWASPSAARHRYLLLSAGDGASGGGGWTAVLEAGGDGLGAAAALPGLQLDAETLLAGALQGGCMFQVTAAAVRVFKPSAGAADAVAAWQPPGGAAITLAAHQGQHLAVACGAEVQVLHCSVTGRLQQERELALPQQASALALFELGGEVWLAAGLWVSNEVLLQPLAADQPACRLDLGACQPRSLLVCELQGGASGGGTDDASSGSSVGSPASSLGSPLGGGSPPRHDSPPRSLASPAAVLLAGTSSGEVLWWRMHVRPDPFGAGGGTVRLEPCGWVRAGLAPVALHVVPADPAAAAASAWNGGAGGSSGCSQAGCPCVLAQSDQGLLLRPASGRLVPSRLHGARGLLAACPLLAPDVPGSRLAYVDQAGQLSIGGLDTQPRLHADLLPLPAGAEASAAAYHAPSGCAAVACSEAGGGASLRLVDAAAMRELARLPMQAGQAITSVAVLPLPCSSRWQPAGVTGPQADQQQPQAAQTQQDQQQQPQQHPACKLFLAVAVSEGDSDSSAGSAALAPEQLPAAADGEQPWWRQQQEGPAKPAGSSAEEQAEGAVDDLPQQRGQLLVFEVQRGLQRPATATGDSEGSSSSSSIVEGRLVLHGRCPLPAAVFSLTTVQPDPQPYNGGVAAAGPRSRAAEAAAPAAQQPLLAAGCDDGTVRLYRLFVDDAGEEGRHAVEQGLAAITAAVPPLRLAGGSPTAAEQAPAAAAAAAGPGSRQGLWHQQVALQLVAKAATLFEGIPAGLAAAGPTLFARDLLASLTAFRAQPVAAGEAASLLPLGADLSGRHLSATLALSEAEVLAGSSGGGLLLVRRDLAAERNRQAAARQRWELAREQGGAGGGGETGAGSGPAAHQPRFVPTLAHAAPLDAAASHETAGSVAAVVPGLLGVPLRQPEELLGSSAGAGCAPAAAPAAVATVVTSSGSVASAWLLPAEDHRVLRQLAAAAEATCYCDSGDGSGGAHKLAVGGEEGSGGGGAAAVAPGLGGCIDGDALVAALQQPAWARRLAMAAPSAALRRGRALMEGYGLL